MSDNETAKAILAVASAPPQKSTGAAAALWFFLGAFGGPWWYLGKPGSAIAAIVVYWTCALLTLVVVGLFLLPVVWIIDLLCIFSTLKKHNQQREQQLRAALATSA